jgi:putative peptidoglycan lipid II flippase
MLYATQVFQFPVGLVATALAFAVLPSMSREAGRERRDGFRDTLSFGMRMSLILMAPAMVGLLVLATPVTALIFQRGQFTPLDTTYTSHALLGYAPQVLFLGVNQLLIYAFYARHNTLVPMLAGATGVAVYVVLAFALFRFSIVGLAVAETIAVVIHTLVLFVLVMRDIGTLRGYWLPETVVKVGLAALAMAGAIALSSHLLNQAWTGFGMRLLDVVIPGGIGVVIYGTLLALLGVEDLPTARIGRGVLHTSPRSH